MGAVGQRRLHRPEHRPAQVLRRSRARAPTASPSTRWARERIAGVGAPGSVGTTFNRWRPNPSVTTGLPGYEGVGGGANNLNVRDTFEPRMMNQSLISPATRRQRLPAGRVRHWHPRATPRLYYEALVTQRDSCADRLPPADAGLHARQPADSRQPARLHAEPSGRARRSIAPGADPVPGLHRLRQLRERADGRLLQGPGRPEGRPALGRLEVRRRRVLREVRARTTGYETCLTDRVEQQPGRRAEPGRFVLLPQ